MICQGWPSLVQGSKKPHRDRGHVTHHDFRLVVRGDGGLDAGLPDEIAQGLHV